MSLKSARKSFRDQVSVHNTPTCRESWRKY